MNKFLLYFIPTLFLIFTVGLMTAGGWLKEPITEQDELLTYIENIEYAMEEEDWEEASVQHQNAERAWDKISKRIQYSVEREDMLDVSETIARMKGGIEEEDPSTISPEMYYFYELWSKLG